MTDKQQSVAVLPLQRVRMLDEYYDSLMRHAVACALQHSEYAAPSRLSPYQRWAGNRLILRCRRRPVSSLKTAADADQFHR